MRFTSISHEKARLCRLLPRGMSIVHPWYVECTPKVWKLFTPGMHSMAPWRRCRKVRASPRLTSISREKMHFSHFFSNFSIQKTTFSQKPGDQNNSRKNFFKSIALLWPISPYCEPHSSICQKKFAVFSIFQKMVSKKARRRPKSKKCHVFKVVDNEI